MNSKQSPCASTTAGPQSWGFSWNYDGFGNRLAQNVTQGSGPGDVVLVNANTNRISSAGYSNDLNGNLTQMPQSGGGSLNLNYDLSNRVASLSHNSGSEEYLYAPDNRRIWRSAGKTFCGASIDNDQQISWSPGTGFQNHYILYSPGGQKLGVYCLNFSPSGQYSVWTASEENVYWGSRLVAKRNGPSMSSFISDRLQSKGNGSAFFPYGESKTGAAGDDKEQFATYKRDEKSGLDYADQRWYASSLGRFTSSDPYEATPGLQSSANWNRCIYTTGDPVNWYDPAGLFQCRPTEVHTDGCRYSPGMDERDPNHQEDDDYRGTPGGGGGESVWKPSRIIGTSNATVVLTQAISECEGSGISKYTQRLKNRLRQTRIVDARWEVGGQGRLAAYTADSRWGDLALYSYLETHSGGSNMRAAVLVTTDSVMTNTIAFRGTFFDGATDTISQSIVGIHELLHLITGALEHRTMAEKLNIVLKPGADDVDAGLAINEWIRKNCGWARDK